MKSTPSGKTHSTEREVLARLRSRSASRLLSGADEWPLDREVRPRHPKKQLMNNPEKLEEDISARPAEVGHVDTGGIVDIPFPRLGRDALLADGLAKAHHRVPNSSWITFRIRSERDFDHAIWLMRLSYLRYALPTATDIRALLGQESDELHLSSLFRSLVEKLVPKIASIVVTLTV
jgi:hypothetical protein